MHYFFGTKEHQAFLVNKPYWQTIPTLVKTEPFTTLIHTYNYQTVFFTDQVHGTTGIIIDKARTSHPIPRAFTYEADWIISNVPKLAIGILTADCVPLLLYDPTSHTVCTIHAGWRGATDGVICNALTAIHEHFNIQLQNIQVYIGPHARTCCYQVDTPFYEVVMQKKWGTSAWYKKNDQLFFDLYACCTEQLYCAGITPAQITDHKICTVCTTNYCSYRRDKEQAGRNINCIFP
jgi:polyphenol oxidase